jgi:hypothetical protein
MWQKDAFLRNLWLSVRWKDIEFVLLDYGSSDGLRDWIVSLPPLLKQNLKYYRLELDTWHMSHAKNVAHLAAAGDILVNLDFDNFLIADYADIVRQIVFDGFVFHNHTLSHRGTYGRIALTRSDFFLLRGYDESFAPMCYQDIDLLNRAKARGMRIEKGHVRSAAIDNPRGHKKPGWSTENEKKGKDVRRAVNPDGFGRAHLVDLNGDCFLTGYPAP